MESVEQSDSWGDIQFTASSPDFSQPIAPEFLATGWQGQLDRATNIECHTHELDALAITVIPIRLQFKLPQTIGFSFPESPDFGVNDLALKSSGPGNASANSSDTNRLAAGKPTTTGASQTLQHLGSQNSTLRNSGEDSTTTGVESGTGCESGLSILPRSGGESNQTPPKRTRSLPPTAC